MVEKHTAAQKQKTEREQKYKKGANENYAETLQLTLINYCAGWVDNKQYNFCMTIP